MNGRALRSSNVRAHSWSGQIGLMSLGFVAMLARGACGR
jgi:hypothetical protein